MTVKEMVRVVCESCGLEATVSSRQLAEDLVDVHRDERHCPHATMEVLRDAR